MFHHASLGSNDLDRAQAFYDAVLSEVGLRRLKRTDRIVAYGLTETLFSLERPHDGKLATVGNGSHIAFHAGNRKALHRSYDAGLAHGGSDDGAPAIQEFDRHYYAAFLRDRDGNKVEIVTFAAE